MEEERPLRSFEHDGHLLRFEQQVDGRPRKFEFIWEEDDSPEGLLAAYASGDERRRFNAVHLMGQNPDPRFTETLLSAASDPHFPGRGVAVIGLAKLAAADRRARKAVFSATLSGDFLLTAAGLQGLALVGGWRAKRLLKKVLKRLMRRSDIMTGGTASTAAALLALAACESMLALGLDASEAVDRLLGHPERGVRAQALGLLARKPEAANVDRMERMRSAPVPECILALEVLARRGRADAVEALADYAESPDSDTRTHAVGALLRVGDAALPHIERLIDRQSDLMLRLQMAQRLHAAGRPLHIALFREALSQDSPVVRQTAVATLARDGSEEALALLKEHVENEPDDFLRRQIRRRIG